MSAGAGPTWFVAGLPVSRRAAAWAAEAHAGQERDVDGAPFVVHALEVALSLYVPARTVACRHAHYLASLALLERRLPDHPFTTELRFELEAQALTPGLAWLGAVAAPAAHVG